MSYCGYITKLKNLRPHGNADRLQLADCFGNIVCVGLDAYEGQLGCYFPCDGQLSEEFCRVHDLVRRKDENGNPAGGYLDPIKRNIKTVKLRGEPSDGLFMDISCLDYCFASGKASDYLAEGDTITVVNGHEICQKYIPARQVRMGSSGVSRTRKHSVPLAPLFKEHADTEQLAYNLAAFKTGDQIEITLKMHGTSGRTAFVPILKGYKRTLWEKLTKKQGTPIYDYDYVSGTRRVVLDSYDGGFYGSNAFREKWHDFFLNKLHKGECCYYEVVGYVDESTPIMAECSNKKVADKEFSKKYGPITTFSYGCNKGENDIYVYRMTMTNEDGDVVEYTPDFMRYRCEQMGVKTVPVFWKGYIPEDLYMNVYEEDPAEPGTYFPIRADSAGNWIMQKAEEFYDGPDPIGKTHIREGVVVRIVNRPSFTVYKAKNFCFKVLEGIVKDEALAPDIEEAQDVKE